MAKKANRIIVGLDCSICKSRNYISSKNTVNTVDKMTFKKYCRVCRKVQVHSEVKKLH